MYKLTKNTFATYEEFFCYGIDANGEQELFEAFLYFAYIKEISRKYEVKERKSVIFLPDLCKLPPDIRDKYSPKQVAEEKRKWKANYALHNRKPSGEEVLEEVITRAKEVALQYYRFVKLHDEKDLKGYQKEKKEKVEEDLEKRLREIVAKKREKGLLTIDNERMVLKDTEAEIEADEIQIKDGKLQLTGGIQIEGTMQKKNGKIQLKIEDANIPIGSNDIHIAKEWRNRYNHFPEGSLFKGQDFVMRNWTEEVYDILTYLEKAEREDKKGYYDLWLRTGIRRAIRENETYRDAIRKIEEEAKIEAEKKQVPVENLVDTRAIRDLQEKIRKNEEKRQMLRPILDKVRTLRIKQEVSQEKNKNLILDDMDTRKMEL